MTAPPPRDPAPATQLVRSVEPPGPPWLPTLVAAWICFVAIGLACEDQLPIASSHFALPPPECLVDDDCGLLPDAMTCCGECDPTPPFVAVPRTTIDAVLLELETACAPRERGCVPPTCKQPPPACEAHAECQAGRCRVVENNCGVRPTS